MAEVMRIKIRAAVHDDDDNVKDTDTATETIYLDENGHDGTYSLNIEEITITPEDAHVKDTVDIQGDIFC